MTIINRPNPNEAFPNPNLPRLCFIKNVVKNPRIIIGTNSVVAKDIPPYAIAVGNPCRVVRKRFDDEMIGILLKLRWWDKSIEEIDLQRGRNNRCLTLEEYHECSIEPNSSDILSDSCLSSS